MSKRKEDDEERQRLIKKEERPDVISEEEEEDGCCTCSFKKIWKSFKSCLQFTGIGIFNTCRCIKNAICNCLGCCFFPIKERICKCCDEVDTDLNPYKNPNYNPYDYL